MKLIQVIIFLLNTFVHINCSSGWSVAGYELTPSDTTENTAYIEIVAHDSTNHLYVDKVRHGDNWCFLHGQWEDVRIK